MGLFVALALVSVGIIGVLMAGWSSANKYALHRRGARRGPADGLRAAVGAGRGERRDGGGHPLPRRHRGVLDLVVAALAGRRGRRLLRRRRSPSCAARRSTCRYADSEIVFGPLTEYTGLRFALFLLAEYAGIVVVSGADRGAVPRRLARPVPRAPARLALDRWSRCWSLSFVVIWLRVAYPRLREDQLQKLAWTVLVPLALLQVVVTAVVRVATA